LTLIQQIPSLQKFIFYALLFSLILSFSQNSYAINSKTYNSALKLYNNEQYELAYQAFSRIVEQDYSAQNANFYLARSATLTKRIDEAIITYERILILNPNNTRSKLELGRLHFQQASYALAESYFKDALQDNVPQQVEENIQQFLASIKQKKNKSSLTAALIIGAGYDNNINTAASASSWYIPVFDLEFENAADAVKNTFHQETAIINHYYDATDSLGYGIKNTLLAYSKAYPGESDYNILYGKYSPALVFSGPKHRTELALEMSHMDYGGQAYIQTYGATSKVSYQPQASENISVQAKVLKKDYQQAEKHDRDSLFTEISMKYQKLSGSSLSWNVNTALQTEQKDSGNLYDVDYQSASIQAGVYYRVSQDVRVGGNIKLEQKNYQDESPFYFNRRQDNKRKATIDISKKITKNVTVQALMERSVNRSNHDPFEYEKNSVAVNLITRF